MQSEELREFRGVPGGPFQRELLDETLLEVKLLMMRTLKVELAVPNPFSVQHLVHNFQNFGEDLYRSLRNECDISLDELSHFTGAFHLRGLHKRDVRTIAAKVRKILGKHHELTGVKIYEVQENGHCASRR